MFLQHEILLNKCLWQIFLKLLYFQKFLVYEKEINLLKQVETLHKNQEESKVMEIANSIQMKLTQKKNKIEALKSKIVTLETLCETLKKVRNKFWKFYSKQKKKILKIPVFNT